MVDREYRNGVVEQAVANATVTVPPAMIERQAHALYHELESTVGERGLEMAQYLEALGKTAEEIEADLRPRAEAEVKRGLVLAAIRDAEKITVSDTELRERIMEDAEVLQRDANQLVLDVYASGRQNMMRDELVIAKTVDFLVEHATPVSPEAAADKADAQARADDEPSGTADEPAGKAVGTADEPVEKAVGKVGKASAPRRPGKKTDDD
jgi:trigger factor